ncbi:MAG: superinfection exclusion B family protein [Gammaproteobacteria bacterium AqS3]|nr:superinfection exclusion B family protein [Gammaproteobacteria bacterium AqS3]
MISEISAFSTLLRDGGKPTACTISLGTLVILVCWDKVVALIDVHGLSTSIDIETWLVLTKSIIFLSCLFSLVALVWMCILGPKGILKYILQRRKESKEKQKLLGDKIKKLQYLNVPEKEILWECLNNKDQTFYRNSRNATVMGLVDKKIVSTRSGSLSTMPYTFEDDIWKYMIKNREECLALCSEGEEGSLVNQVDNGGQDERI